MQKGNLYLKVELQRAVVGAACHRYPCCMECGKVIEWKLPRATE